MTLAEPAPAKVNLTLLVTGRRPDGYHLLDSIVAFGPAKDILHAGAADGLSLRIVGPCAAALAAEPDNLVLRAARALADWAGRPPNAALVLDKRLPVASGIGGGSADAAAALRVLCRLWDVRPAPADLAAIALSLGADVPACLVSRPVRMTGVGEELLPLPPLPDCGLLLVNPGVPVATSAVFKARTAAFSPPADLPVRWADAGCLASSLAASGNDLQAAALGVAPVIGAVLAALRALPGCLLARMSGSGATCFGLFADAGAAVAASRQLGGAWWRCGGPLYEP